MDEPQITDSRSSRRADGVKSQTIDRATLILTCFSAAEPNLTLAELAARLDLNQSTVYRYVATLLAAGLLERNGQRGGYRLGLRVVELACVALNQIEVRREAIPEMDRLRDEMQLLVNLAVLDPAQGDIIHIAHSAPQGWPPRATTPGRRAVAHCTALGKLLLAHQPWKQVRETIERTGWRPYTANSIQDFDRLEDELATIRRQDYSLDDEERGNGSVCLSAPIRDRSDRVIAALSMTGTAQKLTPAYRDEILPHLLEAANRVSYRLGHPGTLAY
jgi:DNA-binding IclR family transcriptional regulator